MNFTKALIENIERTFTYAYAKNTGRYEGSLSHYQPVAFFERQLHVANPFKVFMELDHYAFLKAKKAILTYQIPYTSEQERAAKVFYDVTEKMKKERSDTISLYVEDLTDTGVVKYQEPFVLTTEDTLFVSHEIARFPRLQTVLNVVYENDLSTLLKRSTEQLEALKKCLHYKVSCLIGGAGTGKSTVTAEIIHQLRLNKKEVVVLAPTHKAREALQGKLKDSNVVVKTIHSYIHNPTNCDVIVIDESGMLSTPLFAKLLRIYDDQQLIFVGDKNQLEPVEYGRPFELLQELFPTASLKENKRSEAADIISLGREILGIPQNANMLLENIQVVSTVSEAFSAGAEVALSFTNSTVAEINAQQRIKNGVPAICPEFSVGDIIVAKTNERNRFYNGQIFTIIAYDQIQKKDSERVLKLKSWKDLKNNFDLAYGMTIHKSQGSEWDVVAYQPGPMDYQNLAYVAVTRAKKKLILVGDGIQTEYRPNREWRHIG